MAASAVSRFVRCVAVAGDSDAALVRRFADERCGEAFAELVRRYGPAVFGVCRRALGDHHLAEDAFQAVFVVLARKADTIRPPGAVGGWLYGVARKAAAEARAMRRRKNRESLTAELPDVPAAIDEPDDTAAVVDAEIANLPDIFRAAVLLCEIEGVSRADAAARLGIAPGTLSSRLAAARKLLAERLRRRGVGAVVALGTVAVPEALAKAAANRANGEAAGAVQELSHKVLRTMLISKLKLTAVAAVCAVLVGTFLAPTADARPTPTAPRKMPAQAPAALKPEAWKERFTLEHTHPVVAVAACGDLIAAAAATGPSGTDYVRFWNTSDGKPSDLELSSFGFSAPVRFHFLRFTANDGNMIMGCEHSGTRFRRRPGGIAADIHAGYDLLACSPDLNTLLTRYIGGWKNYKPNQLYLHVNPWEVKENSLNHLAVIEEDGPVTHADVSANDRRFAVGVESATVRVYNRASLKVLHTLPLPKGARITAVRLSDDGDRVAVVGEKGFAKLFDDAGTDLFDLKGHDGTVAAVAFSPDGKRVATAAGKLVRVFDAATGKPIAELAGHKDTVTAVAFGTDGKRIVTGSADKTAKVWERKE